MEDESNKDTLIATLREQIVSLQENQKKSSAEIAEAQKKYEKLSADYKNVSDLNGKLFLRVGGEASPEKKPEPVDPNISAIDYFSKNKAKYDQYLIKEKK